MQKSKTEKNNKGWLPTAALVILLIAALVIAKYNGRQAPEDTRSLSESDGTAAPAMQETGGEEEPSQPPVDKLAFINENPKLFTPQLVEMANQNPDTVDYVYGYAFGGPQSELFADIDTVSLDTVPLFFQWDSRWGYNSYSGGLMGYTGCGPTCLSMAAMYLTKNRAYTPWYVARYAADNGYSVEGHGTAWSLMSEGCRSFGLLAEELTPQAYYVKLALDAGEPVICIMGPGDFTQTGHFIVLTGYRQEGFTVNDPFSAANSEKVWPFDTVLGQAQGIWAYIAK